MKINGNIYIKNLYHDRFFVLLRLLNTQTDLFPIHLDNQNAIDWIKFINNINCTF